MNKADIHIVNPKGATVYHELHIAPASWSEMTREHLLVWAATFGTTLKVGMSRQALAAKLFNVPMEAYKSIPESDSRRLSNSINFLFGKNTLSTWLIPSIWHRFFKYHGPKTALANATVYEYSLCELCYEQFQNTENTEYLYTLAAILYRGRRFLGINDDIRVKLTTYGYVKRAKRFKKLPVALVYAIYLNYEGCRHFLHDKYKDAFSAKSKGRGNKKVQVVTPWPKILEAGSNDIFGTLKETQQTNLHDFLSRLGSRIVEQRELEEKYKKK